MAHTVSVDLNREVVSDLPMIVLLDDLNSADFDVSADEAMVELGIKRSRLGQISGRELRVGKKRVDRYLRPYYRQVDIVAYKERTRPSTTKQRANETLTEAARLIEIRINALLQATNQQLQQTLTDNIQQLRSELLRLLSRQNSHRQQQAVTVQHEKIIGAIEIIARLVQENCMPQAISELQQLIVQQFQVVHQSFKVQHETITVLQKQQQTLEQLLASTTTTIEDSIKQTRARRRLAMPSTSMLPKKQQVATRPQPRYWGSIYYP